MMNINNREDLEFGKFEEQNKLPKTTLRTSIYPSDSGIIDAFGRIRVSNPETLFDSKNIFKNPELSDDEENQPLFYDNIGIGAGTSTRYYNLEASTGLRVSANTEGTRIRQTKQRFNYQPGKSMLVFMTYVFDEQKSGITQREGMFDEDNGIFLEDDGEEYFFVVRSNTTGTPTDIRIAQKDWNLDRLDGTGSSGITLDFTKTQILAFDYEWLGVGRIRIGFVIDGLFHYCHEFLNANNLKVVYMSTPNLPLRGEIINDGTGEEAELQQICSTVISEGGQNPLGTVRYSSTEGTHLNANSENTLYALIGIRLKQNFIGETIDILNTEVQLQTGNHKLEWVLLFNPDIAGTFTYQDEQLSAVQIAKGTIANVVTNGIKIAGGFIESGTTQGANNVAGSENVSITNALKIGSKIDKTSDEIVLCVRPIAGSTDCNVEGSITWRELN